MSRREDRRREQRAVTTPVYSRPAVTTVPTVEPCPSRLGVGHDFSCVNHDDPRGSGLLSVRCWYCSNYSPTSQARVDAWRREQENRT